ncbi:MAG: TonB-dependent receptor, partial [Gemmatimonadales bacterium]
STKELAFTLGGPVVRDRAAFFLDLGLQRDLIPQSEPAIGSDTTGGADSAGVGIRYVSAVRFQDILRNTYGVEAGSFAAAPVRQPSGNFFAKVTLQPAVNNRLELSHNYGHGSPEFQGNRTPYEAYALSSNGSQLPGTINATRLTWTMARGSQLSNELNLAYLRVREQARCLSSSPYSEVVVRADESFLVAGDEFACTENFSNQDVWELTDNLSWSQGSHQLTFGTHTELIRTRRLTLVYPLGQWQFASLDSLEQGLPEAYFRTLPNPALPEVPAADLGINQVGLYAQDQWAATPSLILTAGLRMDVPFFTSSPVGNPLLRSELGIDNTLTPSGNTLWSPRLGFSYDLAGRGFLRGGVGLFSGRPAYHWISSVYAFNGLDASNLFCDGPAVPAFTLDPASQPGTCGSGLFVPTTEVNYFDPAFRFPRSLRVALGTDLRLPGGVVGTVDLLYVRGVNQFYLNDVNLAPTGAAAAEGGRVLYGSHDPATGAGTPNRRSAAFGPVIQVRNSSGDRSYVATVQVQKRFARGAELSLGYTYTDSKDRLSAAADIASLNFGRINTLDGTLEQRRLATSMYSVPHKITLVGAFDLPLRVRFSLFYNGFSGAPYTYRITGDANADGATAFGGPSFNDPMYVPRDAADITLAEPGQWETLDGYIRSRPCLREQRGRLLRRNSCRDPWVSIMDARLSKVVPTTPGQSIELIADLFNVLNLLDRDWAVRRAIPDTRILELVGYDAVNGRGIYVFETRDPNVRDNEATRWRMQLGARYTF